MEDTKLVRILRTLLVPLLPLSEAEMKKHTQKELRRLRSFLSSSFFATPASVTALFEYIIQFAPEFRSDELNEDQALAFLFPDENANSGQIRRLRSKLLRQIETYIYLNEALSEPWAEKLAVLRFLGKNRLLEEFYSYLDQDVKPALELEDFPKSRLFEWQYRINDEIANVRTNFQEDGRSGQYLQETADAFDQYFIHLKLILTCQMLNRQNELPECKPFQLDLAYDLAEILKKEPALLGSPVLQIWYTAFRMLSSEESTRKLHWEKLRNLIDLHFAQLSANEINLIYSYLQNNVRQIADDERERFRVFIQLYESQMDKEVFQNHFTITGNFFYNLIQTYLVLEDIEGAERSMSKHKGILPVLGMDIVGLCYAAIGFAKAEYELALEQLRDIVEITNVYNNVKCRRLMIKTCFELGGHYWSLAEAEIVSFRTYLSRNAAAIGEFHTEANREFNNFTEKLIKTGNTDKKKLRNLEQAIEKYPRLPERAWLLAKCRQLLK